MQGCPYIIQTEKFVVKINLKSCPEINALVTVSVEGWENDDRTTKVSHIEKIEKIPCKDCEYFNHQEQKCNEN